MLEVCVCVCVCVKFFTLEVKGGPNRHPQAAQVCYPGSEILGQRTLSYTHTQKHQEGARTSIFDSHTVMLVTQHHITGMKTIFVAKTVTA